MSEEVKGYLILVGAVAGIVLIAFLLSEAIRIFSKASRLKRTTKKEESLWPEGHVFNNDFYPKN